MEERRKKSRSGAIVMAAILVAILFVAYRVFGPNTGQMTGGEYVYISTGSDYAKMKEALKHGGFVNDMTSFDLLAKSFKLPARVHPGKYRITPGMSNYRMIRMLRNGRQAPVKLVINKLRTKNDLVHIVSRNLEADSFQLRQLLNDPTFLLQYELDTNTAMCAILPDTYEFYWNTSAEKAFKKLAKNYQRFWDENRKQAARKKNITPIQATIVASIVEEESNKPDDKPKIASVYLNRLRINMRLQADPTVKFAVGDFTIRRIGGPMLDYDSPYNTYKYAGLPPGPICTPTAVSIDAVLQAPATTYLYFCAKDDFSGYHVFASTYEEQIKNARAYQKALDARNIH